MPIYVEPVPSGTPGGLQVPVDVVRAGIPTRDNCPILTRINAFIVWQGVQTTLEHVFRDRAGNPVDVSQYVSTQSSQSLSSTSSLVLRAREWFGAGSSASDPLFSIEGYGFMPDEGVVRCELPEALLDRAGIYQLNWAVLDGNGVPVFLNQGMLSVERSLFPVDTKELYRQAGPITIQELRMMMMDSSPSENTLLDDVEFSDDQIMLAMTKPVQFWNEALPPIRGFNTNSFPFRGALTIGIMAELMQMAAMHYRRNYLKHSAGGTEVGDKDKEKEYLSEAERLRARFESWVLNKKVSINMGLFAGSYSSPYSARGGW